MDKQKFKHLDDLLSEDRERMYHALEEIKKSGEVKMIPYVFDVYQKFNDEELKQKILDLLKEIKDKEAPKIIINEIEKRKWSGGLSEALSVCWQSGLDYSPYIEKFVKFVDHPEMEVQIESLTNIEEFFYNKNAVNIEQVKSEIKDIAVKSSGKKRDLIMTFYDSINK